MNENTSKSNINELDNKVIDALLSDPTKSMREIAKDLNSYRQTLWRKKKKMEEENLIWGYTAVIDEEKQGKVTFLILMKTKPMMKEMAELIVRRVKRNEPAKMGIRQIDLFQVNGEYDWVLRFSAPDHATARTYFDTLRALYVDYLLEKPVLVNVNFILVAEGKRNPEIDRLFSFVIAP